MQCLEPFRIGVEEYRCSQCDACLAYRRRTWASRLCLEAGLHKESSFVTLTYADDPWTLSIADYQGFLKRLRYYYEPPLRYFIAGEYGDISWRPHYHAMLFNFPAQREDLVQQAWPHGFVQVRPFTMQRAMYIAGYVLKKMTRDDDPRLEGRLPEFSRMSLRPGIGAGAADRIAQFYSTRVGAQELAFKGDVEACTRMDGQHWPLGRYLRGRIRDVVGFERSDVDVRSRLKRDVGAAAGHAVMDEFRDEQRARREADAARLKNMKRRTNATL